MMKVTQAGQSLVKLAVIAGLRLAWRSSDIQDSPVFTRPVNLHELGEAYIAIAWSLGWHIVLVLGLARGGRLFSGSAGSSTATTA